VGEHVTESIAERAGRRDMPTISMFRGIKIYMNWNDHFPPHFHAVYAGKETIISIDDIAVIDGDIPSKQLKWF